LAVTTKAQRRLYLYFATENDTALILLRAARREWAMILWDRATDSFVDGQWLRKQIEPGACALSPDGAHFLYFVTHGMAPRDSDTRPGAHRRLWHSYTAIGRPPWFTALGVFPHGSASRGGATFLDSRHFWVVGTSADSGQIDLPDGLARVIEGAPGPGCVTGLRLADGHPAPLERAVTERLRALLPEVGRDGRPPTLMWLWRRAMARDQDALRDRYDTLGGRLFRCDGMELTPIRDFDGMAFRPVRAPWDDRPTTDRTPSRWHPLEDDA
jgi:hypothetical protein